MMLYGPIVFRGEQLALGKGGVQFLINHNDPMFGGHFHGCMGYANQLLDGRTGSNKEIREWFHVEAPIATWGFYGEGTRMLAVTMLAIVLKDGRSLWPRYAHRHRCRRIILKLHDKYAREVLAKLPPNWTITGEEVKAWVKKQRKKHDKILREDKQKQDSTST